MNSFRLSLSLAGLLALLTFWLGSVAPARATNDLSPKLAELAKKVKQFLDGRSDDRIILGEFRSQAGLNSNAGPGLEDLFAVELTKLSIRIDKKANLSLYGDYFKIEDKQKGLLTVKISILIRDNQGEEPFKQYAIVQANAEIAKVLGLTVLLPPNGTYETRNEKLREKINNPSFHHNGTLVSTTADSPFAVELLVRPQGGGPAEPRKPVDKDGEAFVDVGRGEIYEVRIHNKSHLETAITLTIDGLDVFTFSNDRDSKTGRPRYTHFIVAPRSTATIPGWHKTNKEALSFLVTKYGEGAASQTKQARGKVGVITVTFAYAWSGPKPPEEARTIDGGNETGFGPPQKTDLREVQRTIGIERDVVSIRYSR